MRQGHQRGLAKILAATAAGIILAGCSSEGATEPAGESLERGGELRPGKSYAALRVAVGSGVDSMLAGPGGDKGYFVSRPNMGQILVVHPNGDALGENIRFRIFTSAGKDARDVVVTYLEGALPNGDSEIPEGSVVWNP